MGRSKAEGGVLGRRIRRVEDRLGERSRKRRRCGRRAGLFVEGLGDLRDRVVSERSIGQPRHIESRVAWRRWERPWVCLSSLMSQLSLRLNSARDANRLGEHQNAQGDSSNPRLPGRLRLDQTCALPAHCLGPERGKERTHVAGKIWLQLLWPGRDKRVFKVRGRRGVLGFEIGRKGRERGGRDVGTVRLVVVVEWAWRNRRNRRRGHSRRL